MTQPLLFALTAKLGDQRGQFRLGMITGVMNKVGGVAIEFVPPPVDAEFLFHKALLNTGDITHGEQGLFNPLFMTVL
jgi:hypothetical protein